MDQMDREDLADQARGSDAAGTHEGDGLLDRAREAAGGAFGGDKGDERGQDGGQAPAEDSGDLSGGTAPYTSSSYTESGGGDEGDLDRSRSICR
ncbi:MAG: hypothetical protein ACR2JC_13285 [Chloroflexota bacterium]|nr:MAG: hypothetical protein DLM70_14985 [Chloroflexota bacterium]